MGPRSHERGNAVLLNPASSNESLLQWGRVLMNAETEEDWKQAVRQAALQWGRVLMNAETSRARSC